VIASTKTYQHGTRARYTLGRCRCDDCRRANSDYAIARERRLTLASFGCADPLTVDAAEVREHLLFLRDAGVGLRRIASVTGVSRTTLYQLRTGESRRVTWRCADRILGVCTGDRAPGARPRDVTRPNAHGGLR
jgi:hypothetical protein